MKKEREPFLVPGKVDFARNFVRWACR